MEKNRTDLQNIDPNFDKLKEMEMIPLARAMVGMDIPEMRKIDPKWCVRPEAQKIYARAIKTPDAYLLPTFNPLNFEDEYLERATRHIGEAQSIDVINRMRELWRERTENALLKAYVDSKTCKQKIGYLNLLKNLNREDDDDIYIVDLEHPSPPEVFILERQGVGILPRGEISDIKAKAKSGKTQLVIQFSAALISPNKECNGIRRIDDEPMDVLWIDTEQSHSSSDNAYRRTMKLAGLEPSANSPHLKLINTRKKNAAKRWEALESELLSRKYDVVIIDGLRDFFQDINDPAEATAVFEKMLTLTQETRCSFVLVIHENPGDTGKMRGWMGTEAENKCYEVFQVRYSKDSEVFTVETPDRRGPTMPPFGFKFEDNQLVGCEPEAPGSLGQGQNAKISREERDWNIFAKAWEQNPHLAWTKEEMVTVHLRMGTLKESTTKNRIKQYLAQGKIVCLDDPTKKGARYGLNIDEVNKMVNRGTDQTDEAPF